MLSTASMAALATCLYLVAATVALAQGLGLRRSDRPGDTGPWYGVAILLFLAAALRLSDGSVVLASILHQQVLEYGLFEWRRFIQVPALILAVLLAGISFAYILNSRAISRTGEKLAFANLLLLMLLVAMRTLSLHATDALLDYRLGPFKAVWLIEAGLLLSFILSALLTNLLPMVRKR